MKITLVTQAMNKVIVHTCSSVLVRPNGIVRYINAVMDLQRSLGHHVIFVTDARPTQKINADETIFLNLESQYQPNWRDGHVWLQVDRDVAYDIEVAFRKLDVEPGLVVAHDLHSFLGCKDKFKNGVFVQHESDVYYAGARYSFLSDEYLQEQIDTVNTTSWRIGLNVPTINVAPLRPVYTPAPFTVQPMPMVDRTRGLLYIGDATERKGAREFMQAARALGVTPTVITHEPDAALFADADVYTFGLHERAAMYELMAQHRVAYVPSRNECPGLAALECLQFMPVVVDGQYAWTSCLADLGVIRATGAEAIAVIDGLLKSYTLHDRKLLEIWASNNQKLWTNLSQ
jgi:hypothetical protein